MLTWAYDPSVVHSMPDRVIRDSIAFLLMNGHDASALLTEADRRGIEL